MTTATRTPAQLRTLRQQLKYVEATLANPPKVGFTADDLARLKGYAANLRRVLNLR